MIIEAYRCIADEEFIRFKTMLHKVLYNAETDPDVNEVDVELFRLHLIDLYDELHEIING